MKNSLIGGEILCNYWPKETLYVKQEYKTIPFPFEEIAVPKLEMIVNWSFDDYLYGNMVIGEKITNGKKYDPLSIVKEEMKNL